MAMMSPRSRRTIGSPPASPSRRTPISRSRSKSRPMRGRSRFVGSMNGQLQYEQRRLQRLVTANVAENGRGGPSTMYVSRLVAYAYPSASLSASRTESPEQIEPHDPEVRLREDPCRPWRARQEEGHERYARGERACLAERVTQGDEQEEHEDDQHVAGE